jgi:hypothetical protein
LKATAKPVRELAEKIDIESVAGYRVHFHALGCEAQRSRAPAKLSLAFAKVVDAPHVALDLRQDIPIAARLAGAAVHALDGEKLRPICHPAAMMPGHAGKGRAIYRVVLAVFHTIALPRNARHAQVE